MKPYVKNPWAIASNLEEFQFFCCPDCDIKEPTKDTFVKHALETHPEVKMYLEKLLFKQEIITSDAEYLDENYQNYPENNLKIQVKEEYVGAQQDFENVTTVLKAEEIDYENETFDQIDTKNCNDENILETSEDFDNDMTQFDEENQPITKSFGCYLCSKSFKMKHSVKRHLERWHSIKILKSSEDEIEYFLCSICNDNNNYTEINDIRDHLQVCKLSSSFLTSFNVVRRFYGLFLWD